MTERKFTDEEIIKALECCDTSSCADCEVCPYTYEKWCVSALTKDALDLINRQKAEIERLETEKSKVHRVIPKMIEAAKTEAIKEFAERLSEDRVSNDPVVIAVKAELKEMTGEQQ